MKLHTLLLLFACILALTSTFVRAEAEAADDEGVDFKSEFFQGMESGFFLRDTENGHREYECPDSQVDNDRLKKVNSVMGPVQMLLNLTENDMIKTAFRSIDTIVNATFEILAVIHGYQGSEFCQGLLFGIHGSNLVLNLGKDIVKQVESLNELASQGPKGRKGGSSRK